MKSFLVRGHSLSRIDRKGLASGREAEKRLQIMRCTIDGTRNTQPIGRAEDPARFTIPDKLIWSPLETCQSFFSGRIEIPEVKELPQGLRTA